MRRPGEFRPEFTALRRGLVFILAVFVCAWRVPAAEPVELIPGLTYLRVTDYTADPARLATAFAAHRPVIVDLRYPPADGAAQFPLSALLAQRPSDSTQALFLLVSPETPAALAAAIHPLPRGAVTLGIADSQPAPAVIIAQPADTDRRAHDAWSDEIPLASLITGKLEKERFDEAALVKEFRNGSGATTPVPAPIADPAAAAAKEGVEVPVLTDRVLQRAVHLHRALLALKPR